MVFSRYAVKTSQLVATLVKLYKSGQDLESLRKPAESISHLLKRIVRFEKKIQPVM